MGDYNFDSDLKTGHVAEAEVVPLVKKYVPSGFLYVQGDRYEKSHDLLFVNPFTSKKLLIEVKWDQMSERTRNVAVEFQCSGKDSGILTSEAPMWAVKYHDTTGWVFRAVTLDKLKQAFESRKYKAKSAGDQKRATVFLVPVNEFSTWGVRLWP